MKHYAYSIILLCAIILGGLTGYLLPASAPYLKPLGEIFLNLIFTTIVPLIFFSIASAIAEVGSLARLGKILGVMAIVFIGTGLVAAVFMLGTLTLFPLPTDIHIPLLIPEKSAAISLSEQIVNIFTVSDFSKLLSHEHMLALILFSLLVGIATSGLQERRAAFSDFLKAGERISMRVFSLIMLYAPVGFFAYFAVIVSELGPKLLQSYMVIAVIYYLAALVYFFAIMSGYAYLAGGMHGIKLFWRNVFLPAATAVATCSSAASIPANLSATERMGVSPEIYETLIPLGSLIHKDGSVMGGIVKIIFLFSVFHLPFSGVGVVLIAIMVSLLVGTVMGAIPSGGMLGELLILTVYGFPPSALLAIAAISIIIDPPATMLNVTGNSVSSMLVARLVGGKSWFAGFNNAVKTGS